MGEIYFRGRKIPLFFFFFCAEGAKIFGTFWGRAIRIWGGLDVRKSADPFDVRPDFGGTPSPTRPTYVFGDQDLFPQFFGGNKNYRYFFRK